MPLKEKSDLRIVFMGTPEFAVPSLRLLAESGFRPEAVVTGRDRPRGRGLHVAPTPVKKAAQELEITTILQPLSVKDPGFARVIGDLTPDIIIVVAFRILPPAVYTAARLGAFNLHASLLPRYRGAAPIHRAVMAGERETGVTTFFLQASVDTGAVILRRPVAIGPEETTGDVHDRLMQVGARAVVETVRRIAAGDVRTDVQDDADATRAPKIFKEDCRLLWDVPAEVVHNHCRGLSPHPGAWTCHGSTRFKIYRTRLCKGSGRPGEVLEAGAALRVACGDGAIEILELQQAGHRRMAAAELLNGYALKTGTLFAGDGCVK